MVAILKIYKIFAVIHHRPEVGQGGQLFHFLDKTSCILQEQIEDNPAVGDLLCAMPLDAANPAIGVPEPDLERAGASLDIGGKQSVGKIGIVRVNPLLQAYFGRKEILPLEAEQGFDAVACGEHRQSIRQRQTNRCLKYMTAHLFPFGLTVRRDELAMPKIPPYTQGLKREPRLFTITEKQLNSNR
jgi:hypothetical protein